MRVLNANYNQSQHGVFTENPESLTNDFFVNLLDMNTTWNPADEGGDLFECKDYNNGKVKWAGFRVDLVFGSNSELRANSEVYASSDAKEKFVHDFISA